jgi:hypothetical protein
MTLAEALATLKDANVLRAALKVEGLELSVEFQRELPAFELPAPPAPVRAGGWKGPQDLDAGYQDPDL